MAGEGPMLVIAGAGSGKTRALTYRVSRLIEDGVDPAEILLVTFTNKAAREMLSRVEQLVTTDTRRIWGGTFHSIGNRLLRRHAESIGYRSNFSILDDEDAKEMMESAISSLGINTLEKRFPKGDVLLDIYSYLINTRTPLELHLEQNYPHFALFARRDRERVPPLQGAQARANAMDFDDLLVFWKLLLDEHAEVVGGAQAALPPHPRRRVSGHEQAAGRHRRLHGLGAPQRDGRRRRRAVDLLVPRRVVREHPHVPAALPRRHDLQAGDELPLDAPDPGARQRLDRARTAFSSARSCRPCAATGPIPRSSASTTCSSRPRSSPSASSSCATKASKLERDRGALPLALPVARAADGADAAAHPVRDPLRRALLRAGAHQGRARVSEDRHEPARRAVVEAGAEALSEGRRENGGGSVGADQRRRTNPLDAFLRGRRGQRPRTRAGVAEERARRAPPHLRATR